MNKDLYFEYTEDFADYITERFEDDDELFLSVVGKFEEIKDVIKELMVVANVEFDMLSIQSPEVDGYTDEYVLDCWCGDDSIQIGCEPAKRNGKYLDFYGDETYLFSNCNSRLISSCDDSELYFVNIGEEYECDEDCCECCCSCCNDEPNITYYIIDGLTDGDIISILDEFGF